MAQSLNTVDKLFKAIFEAHSQIQGRYTMGSELDLSSKELQYPRIHIIPQQSQINLNVVTHTLFIMCVDTARKDDNEMLKDVWSDTQQILVDVVKLIRSYDGEPAWFDLQGEPTMVPILEDYRDRFTGFGMTLQLQVDLTVGDCDIPVFNPEICGSSQYPFVVAPTGPQGGIGIQGPQGFQGSNGSQGSQGFQGLMGKAIGSQGFQGLKGDIGKGAQGPQGFQGIQGSIGSIGFQGLKGDIGNTGSQGPHGNDGSNGSNGPQGFQGFQGNSGTYIKKDNITLTQSTWTFSTPYWNYTITDSDITSPGNFIIYTPYMTNISTVIDAIIYPYILVATGSATLYSENQPSGNIIGEMVILK